VTEHFLVIGAQRCGTTWLHRQLEAQPGIAMARPTRPEPKVFLDDLGPHQDRAWYVRTWFAHARPGQVLGEKSTSYLERPDAIDRIRSLLGPARIVVQLRDPVERAVSNWRFSTDSGLEQRPLEDALAANLAGPLPWDPARTSVSPYAYLERGCYAAALKPWLTACGDLVHVQFLEEALDGPAGLAATVEHVGAAPSSVTPPTRDRVNASGAPPPALDPTLTSALREYFHDSDRQLELLLGRELPWAGTRLLGAREDRAR